MAGGVDQQGSQAGGRTEHRVNLVSPKTGGADLVKALIETPAATRAAKSARRDPRPNRASQLGRIAALCLAPAAVFLLILIAYPLSRVIWSAFHYVNLTNPTVAGFAGLDTFYTISLLAALMSVPKEVIESAAIDGAGPLQRFVHITMPISRPSRSPSSSFTSSGPRSISISSGS
jgi:ABC-type spermidine/putrescine transport system permease subunit II